MRGRGDWYIFTPQGFVLLALARFGDLTVDELAERIACSRWTVLRALKDLRAGDMVSVTQNGRRNRYSINMEARFRNPLLRDKRVGRLLRLFAEEDGGSGAP